ncbi:MAG: OmpA family protein [Thiotrichales bacterium]
MNLLELLKEQVAAQLTERAPSLLGVTADDAEATVARLLPSLLAGMVQRASTEHGARELFDAVTDPSIDTSLVSNPLAGLVGGEATERLMTHGKRLLRSVFGDRAPLLKRSLSDISGIDEALAGNWLHLALPLWAANLKKLIWRENLDAKGFTALLAGQGRFLESTLDPRVLAALGAANGAELFDGAATVSAQFSEPARQRSRSTRAEDMSVPTKSGVSVGWKILAWLLVLLLSLGLLTMCDREFWSRFSDSRQAVSEQTPSVSVEPASEPKAVADEPPSAVTQIRTDDAASVDLRVAPDVAGESTPAPTQTPEATPEVAADDVATPTPDASKTETPGAVEPTSDAIATAVDSARSSGEAAAQAAQGLVGAVGAVTDKVVEKIRGVKLPDGATLELSEGSPVDQIVQFLTTRDAAVPATFILDGLSFERASSRIADESMKIVVDLATTMQAYPQVHIRLEGHTDNTGSSRNNKRLSAERAAAVREALITHEVNGDRITTLGLGPERPVADNASAAGRAQNRRVEVIITQR